MSTYTLLRKAYPRMWRIWYRMCCRCNHNERWYEKIKVCDDWNIDISGDQGFINFVEDMLDGYEDHLEIDRINTDAHYDAHNCRWVSRTENMNNLKMHSTERGRWLLHIRKNNKNQGAARMRFWQRIRRGWSPKDAATIPPFGKPRDRQK